jgi:hypothetical protein
MESHNLLKKAINKAYKEYPIKNNSEYLYTISSEESDRFKHKIKYFINLKADKNVFIDMSLDVRNLYQMTGSV